MLKSLIIVIDAHIDKPMWLPIMSTDLMLLKHIEHFAQLGIYTDIQ
jgi:hypothetical protein